MASLQASALGMRLPLSRPAPSKLLLRRRAALSVRSSLAGAPQLPGSPPTLNTKVVRDVRILTQADAAVIPTLRRPQGFPCWNPLLGDIPELLEVGMVDFLLRRYEKFGPMFTFRMLTDTVTVIMDLDTIRYIYSQDGKMSQFHIAGAFNQLVGKLSAETNASPAGRLKARRLLAPAFSTEALVGYAPRVADILAEKLARWESMGPVEIRDGAKSLSFEFATQLVVNFKIAEQDKAELRRNFDTFFQGLSAPPLAYPGGKLWRALRSRDWLLKEIRRRLAEQTTMPTGAMPAIRERAMIDYAYDAVRASEVDLTQDPEDEMAQSAVNLLMAANDTSGVGLQLVLATLAALPHQMQPLRDEQQRIIAKYGPEYTKQALDAMTYTDAFVKEVMRVLPVSTQRTRTALADLQVGDVYIPKGSVILLSTMGGHMTDKNIQDWDLLQGMPLHMDPSRLDESFKPERWLSADGKPTGVLGFGHGPHVCLGLPLFYMEAKTLLAMLARDYDVQLKEGSNIEFVTHFMTTLKKPAFIDISKRAAHAAA